MNSMQNLSIKNSTHEKKPKADKEMTETMEKSSAMSEKVRKEGNKLYGQKNHSKDLHKAVLWAYSKSVAYALEKSEQLAAAYSNRSVLLIHLGRYKESLADIDRALQITKSDTLLTKLVARKANLVNSNKVLIKSLNLEGLENQSSDKPKDNGVLSLPSIIKPSPIIPCASEAVLLKYNKTFGRHFIASRNIKPGEVIITEEGYTCMPKNNLRYFLCSHCLQFTWNGIPCNSCPFVIYCSEDCKKEAWQDYHDIECQISSSLSFLQSNKKGCVMADIFIALRIFLKAVKKEGLDAVLDEAETIDNEKDNKIQGLLSKGILENDKFRSCYNLSDNVQYDAQTNNKNAYTTKQLIDLFLCKTNILDAKKNSEKQVSNMLITQLKTILTKIRHIVDINALSYQASICDCPDLDQLECNCGSDRGMIIAPCSSLVNHSCCSNVSRIFLPKKRIAFFAVTSIKKGEQLCDSYGPSIQMEKRARQNMLQKNFYFTCMCKACTENWPHEPNVQLFVNTKTATNTMCQIIYEFKKFYPKETELFLFQDPEEIWGINEESLEKAKLTCELIFKYSNDYMKAFLLSHPYRYFIDRVIFQLYGEKCAIASVCA